MWNHRIVRKKIGNEFQFGIYEAFYKNKCQKPWTITECMLSPCGEDMEDLILNFKQMGTAFKLPTIDYDTREIIK